MAAALSNVIRGGRSGASSQQVLPALSRLILQKGVLSHVRSSPTASAAGTARLMHTGNWRNATFGSTKQPFGGRGFLSYQKLVRMDQCVCPFISVKFQPMDNTP